MKNHHFLAKENHDIKILNIYDERDRVIGKVIDNGKERYIKIFDKIF